MRLEARRVLLKAVSAFSEAMSVLGEENVRLLIRAMHVLLVQCRQYLKRSIEGISTSRSIDNFESSPKFIPLIWQMSQQSFIHTCLPAQALPDFIPVFLHACNNSVHAWLTVCISVFRRFVTMSDYLIVCLAVCLPSCPMLLSDTATSQSLIMFVFIFLLLTCLIDYPVCCNNPKKAQHEHKC